MSPAAEWMTETSVRIDEGEIKGVSGGQFF